MMSVPINRRDFIKTGTAATAGLIMGCSVRNRFDLIIKNGRVLDGTGAAGQRLDVGISGQKISALANLSDATADRIIDATNHVVAPGFIDIHTHTDEKLLVNPKGESKIRQGITTEIGGNCGASPFPLNDMDFGELNRELREKYDLSVTWRDIAEFYVALEQQKIGMNFASFTGHGQLRSTGVGKNDVPPTSEQMRQMRNLLAKSLENGSLGLSTGLEYAPGSYAKTDELIQLCQVVAQHGGVYATHLRNEDDTVEEAISEALEICRQAEVSLQISHFKACNQANWHKVEHMLEMIQTAAQSGLPVTADRYPYIAYGTGLTAFLPLWSRQGTTTEILARLSDRQILPKIEAYTLGRGKRIGGWDRVVISACNLEKNKKLEGQSILQAAEATGVTPFECIRQLLREEKLDVGIVGFAMDENNLKKVLASPLVMVGSDGSAVAPYGRLGEGKPHPRFYGSFPRVLGRYAREEKIFDLATAVKKMTSMPAEKLGLKQRGVLAQGNFADVVIFNPQTVIDHATFEEPHQYPTGIAYVLVNGVLTIENGKHTGALAGQILRHG
jgi:N-acyl-D-amino-acid deacylase